MAIPLQEEGLYERCRIYATDFNEGVLRYAREGIFPLKLMKDYTENYICAGGARAFSEYYTAQYDSAIFRPALKRNLVFAQRNLTMDTSFNEFHLISACAYLHTPFGIDELVRLVHGVLAPR